MRKTTKGAVAASVAALLLLGAWGTQASWSDDQQMPGTALSTGHLKLINANCSGWLLKVDVNDPSPVTVDPSALKLGPGNILTQTCTFEVDALGANVKAKLVTSTPQTTGDAPLTGALNVAATYKNQNGVSIGTTPVLNDGDVVKATLQVTLPSTVDNLTQDLDAALDAITVTASTA